MNWLFLSIAVVSGIGAAVTRHRLKSQAASDAPGYSSTDGRVFALNPVEHLERGVDWWPELVEEFHSSNRARIVLRFGVRARVEPKDVRELLQVSSHEVAQRTNAHVVYAEAHSDGELRGAYMWAPDGCGWSGGETTSEVWFDASAPT